MKLKLAEKITGNTIFVVVIAALTSTFFMILWMLHNEADGTGKKISLALVSLIYWFCLHHMMWVRKQFL